MSMVILCDSSNDLSQYYSEYGLIKCKKESVDYMFNFELWTIDFDFFDVMITDAYDIWLKGGNDDSVLLMEFLEKIIPLCSQVVMFWSAIDQNKMIYLDNIIELKKYVKQVILSDYKCMFYCWYKNSN